jgi:hypothetical protein
MAQKGFARVETDESRFGDRVHAGLASGKTDDLSFSEKDTVERCLDIERRKLVEFFGEDAPKAVAYREDPSNPGRMRKWIMFQGNNGGPRYEHSCLIDVLYRYQERAIIFEYKSLAGDVPESPRNLQLRDQQCIVRGDMLITGDIGVCVIQPLVETDPPICVYTMADSKKATEQMMARVVASNTPNAPRAAGDLQCKFCLAKPRCVQYQQWAGSLLPSDFSNTLLLVPVEEWTVDQRVAAANALGPAQDLLDLIKGFIKKGLETDANFCPGWYLKDGNRVETITDPQGVFDGFVKLGGTVDQFMKAIKVTKEKLKEQVSALTGAKGKALDKAIKTLTDGKVEVRQNAPSLKKEDA